MFPPNLPVKLRSPQTGQKHKNFLRYGASRFYWSLNFKFLIELLQNDDDFMCNKIFVYFLYTAVTAMLLWK